MSIPSTLYQTIGTSNPFIINVDSTKRDNFPTSSSTEFRIKLNFPILYARKVRLVSATIPYTTVVFNDGTIKGTRENNHIIFEDSTLATIDVTIPVGTYNITDLINAMKTAMEAASPDTFTFTYDLTTLKLTISSSDPNFSLKFADSSPGVNNTLWYEIGFNNVDTAISATQVGVRNVLLTGPPNYFISLGELRRPIADTESFTTNFMVPINVNNYGDIIHYVENSGYNSAYDVEVKNLQYLTVILTSDFGVINNQNSDWGFVLAFE